MTYPAEAEVFRTEVRKVLAEELPADWRGIGAIPTEAETEDYVARWRAVLHRRGLLGITWPVEYGGRGLSQLHQVVLVEELTRAGLPFGRQLRIAGDRLVGQRDRRRRSGRLAEQPPDDLPELVVLGIEPEPHAPSTGRSI